MSVFGVYKLLEWQNLVDVWSRSYLEDFVYIPVILKSAQLVVQFVSLRWKNYTFSALEILTFFVIVSVWFELVMPSLHPSRYTADPVDVLFYGAGTVTYLLWMNTSLIKTSNAKVVDRASEEFD